MARENSWNEENEARSRSTKRASELMSRVTAILLRSLTSCHPSSTTALSLLTPPVVPSKSARLPPWAI
jgi:hypothetical protein